MFKAVNPYDDIVTKATEETLTSEDWGVIITLCDKVNDEGDQGAQNVVAALLKRLTHRNANVQLYALALADALVKNCKLELHREISSRAFTAGMERLISDRTTHEKVKKRGLALIKEWAHDFRDNGDLGIMDELYQSLKARHYHFETPEEPPPPHVDDEIRRREEEELQRVLEMSVHETRGSSRYGGFDVGSSSGAGGSGSGSSSLPVQDSAPKAHTSRMSSYAAMTSGGPRSPSPKPAHSLQPLNGSATTFSYPTAGGPPAAAPVTAAPVQAQPVADITPPPPVPVSKDAPISRVRALHTFEPTGRGELAFEKGDIIKVVDRAFKDWWRGQLRGKTGIFPVNYVEAIPDPTPLDLQKEAEMEAQVFAQAANIDRLLSMLRGLDPSKDNLADNEEIQELYRQSLSLRPKIVKLIDKYTQKKDDLMGMNEGFLKARKLFDRMMEESLAVHNPGVSLYDYARGQQQQQQYPYDPRQSTYGYPAQGGYNGYPQEGYGQDGQYGQQQGYPPQGYVDQRGYDAGGYSQGSQQPGYDQYTQQQAYQYSQQPQQQQPQQQPDGRAQQYAENQQQPPYGQSPYPQAGPAAYPEQAPQSAYPPQAADPNGQYPDENARLWAEYYAAQSRAQDGHPQPGPAAPGQPQPASEAQAPPQQSPPQDPSQYPPQQPAYGPTGQPGPQLTASYYAAPSPAAPPQGAPSTGSQAAPAGQQGQYPPQQQQQPPYLGYDQPPRQDASQPLYGMPPAGAPVRQGSISQAQANRQSMASPPAQPPYSPGGHPQEGGQYQNQYASMHQGFANMGVADPGAPSPAPVA